MTDNTTSAEKREEYCIVGNEGMMNGSMTGTNYHIVEIRDGVTHIPAFAFRDAHIDRVILPRSLTSIGYGAFRDSTVQSVLVRGTDKDGRLKDGYSAMDDRVAEIHTHAFDGCRHLKVFEPQYVEKIFGFAFANSSLSADDIHFVNEVEIMDFA